MRVRRVVWLGLLIAAVGGILGEGLLNEGRAAAAGPAVAVSTRQAAYRPGDTLAVSVSLTNPGPARPVDAYLGVLLSDGRTALYLSPAGFTQTVAPLARAYSLAAGASIGPVSVLSFVLGPSVPAGTYTWAFTLTDPDNPGAVVASARATISVGASGSGGTPPAGGFVIEMPVLATETANTVLGIWPFGVHGADHTYDGGHPGWDFEYVAGASVRAAADGTVQSVMTDVHDPTKTTVQIQHQLGRRGYRTVYTNIENPVVAVGARVTAGQPIGLAGRVDGFRGRTPVVYYMTHFQLDDFSFASGIPGQSNATAVSPEPYLSPQGRAIFDRLWAAVAYDQELTEPFASNPRTAPDPFPIRRTWTLQSKPSASPLPPRIEFTYQSPATDPTPQFRHDYALIDASGAVVEGGSVELQTLARPFTTIDLQPRDRNGQASGPPRLGVYDIVSGTMRIDFGPPGAARPSDLSNAGVYTTQ
jgi:murein DD-endopeptidase MepM/ murein hydrolase activator NlpD